MLQWVLCAFFWTAVPLFCIIFYICLTKRYEYWTKLRVPGPIPTLFFGNLKDIMTMKMSEALKYEEIYNSYKDEKYLGLYYLWKPFLLIRDEELIKKITVIDFDNFTDHPPMSNSSGTDSIDYSLFTMKNEIWKEKRQLFSKLFTLKKMKEKENYLKNITDSILCSVNELAAKNEDFRLELIMQKYTLRAFSSVFYGIDISESKEEKRFNEASDIFASPPTISVIKSLTYKMFPRLYSTLALKVWPPILWDYFSNFTRNIILQREEKCADLDDLISILIKMKNEGTSKDKEIVFEELVGHVFSFFSAGHHTTQYTLCHILLQLSLHPDVQEKLKNEIDEILKESEEISYESLNKMTYMDQVISESLRLHPLLGVLKRVCTRSYKVDDSLTIPEGMEIVLPVSGLHHDSKYFPEPEEFRPERFVDKADTPFVYMPFGKGPRTCIGIKFAELEMKYFLALLLSLYEILPSSKMSYPMIFDAKIIFITYQPIGGIWVKLKQREVPILKV